jgi:glycosyltransferase involved in cell wall biosynthesis
VPSLEIIVVDDGSRPSESETCKKVCEKYACVYFKKENGGQGDARNFGVSKASGKYLCFLDQDDFYLPNHHEVLLAFYQKTNVTGWVYGDVCVGDVSGQVVNYGLVEQHSSHPKYCVTQCLKEDMFILPSASLISKKAFDTVGGFDGLMTGYEDDDLFLRMFRFGFSNAYTNQIMEVWCIHENSTSYSVKMNRSRLYYVKKLIKEFPVNLAMDLNYTRDLIAPRFIKWFVGDALKARITDNPDFQEHIAILDSAISLFETYVSDEELIVLKTLASWLTLDKKSLVNSLYASKLAERYSFYQTFFMR